MQVDFPPSPLCKSHLFLQRTLIPGHRLGQTDTLQATHNPISYGFCCTVHQTATGRTRTVSLLFSLLCSRSVWEIIGQSDGGLSVLRTFRLLRVLKLVRFMPALRRQLVVLMKTMDNVATFCMLLMLFIFIFRYQRRLLFSLN